MTADAMPIGEFSRRTSCAIETIRFYEKVAFCRRRGGVAGIAIMLPVMSDGWSLCAGRVNWGLPSTKCAHCWNWPRQAAKPARRCARWSLGI